MVLIPTAFSPSYQLNKQDIFSFFDRLVICLNSFKGQVVPKCLFFISALLTSLFAMKQMAVRNYIICLFVHLFTHIICARSRYEAHSIDFIYALASCFFFALTLHIPYFLACSADLKSQIEFLTIRSLKTSTAFNSLLWLQNLVKGGALRRLVDLVSTLANWSQINAYMPQGSGLP